jgi:hypothetical protein
MNLSDEDIAGFVELWKKETGKAITPEQSRWYASNLLSLLQTVLESQHEEPP